jgi:hypothetical protein
MTDRVFEDAIAFEVSAKYSAVEFYLYEDRGVKATRLKNFLIKSGY